FQAETPLDTLLLVIEKEPEPPSRLRSGLPRDLETICLKCLHKNPEQRYTSAEALAEDLERFLTDRPIQARRTSAAEHAWRWCRRNPGLATLTAAVITLLLAGAAGSGVAAVYFARLAKQAREAETESQRRLVQQYVANGERLAEEGDLCSALAWMAEAL